MTAVKDSPTRRRILHAATEQFAARGIRRTPIEHVAEAAGVHRVTVHRVFPGGRDELVAEVLLERALAALAAALPPEEDTRPTSELLVDAFTSFVMLGRTDPLIHEGLCSDAAGLLMSPERLARFFDMTNTWRARIAPTAARDDIDYPHDPHRVTDLWARTVLTLVREPGIVATEDDVRAYLSDFVIPAVTRPAPRRRR